MKLYILILFVGCLCMVILLPVAGQTSDNCDRLANRFKTEDENLEDHDLLVLRLCILLSDSSLSEKDVSRLDEKIKPLITSRSQGVEQDELFVPESPPIILENPVLDPDYNYSPLYAPWGIE